jgi:hypothetical protein
MKKRHHKKKGRTHHAKKTMGMMTMGMNVKSISERTMHPKKSSVGILHELERTKKTHKLGRVY